MTKLEYKECKWCGGTGSEYMHIPCPDCQGHGQWFVDETGKGYSFDEGIELIEAQKKEGMS